MKFNPFVLSALAGIAGYEFSDLNLLAPLDRSGGYLNINPDKNRADRRRVFKLRGTPPDGVIGDNQRQRVLAWQRKQAAKV